MIHGIIKKKHRFLQDEDMLKSGIFVNGLIDEMEELAKELNKQVNAELQYAKGKIVEQTITEVKNRTIQQSLSCNYQRMSVMSSTFNYNTVYNAIAVQPITITYRLKEPIKIPSTIYAP